ncbi:MAG: response regulator [Eubacterium sp.]|nr:response regulator [Eubacterium sp.]
MKKKTLIFIRILLACLIALTCVFGMLPTVYAAPPDEFLSGFLQTVYNQENGLGSAEVNCIYQTRSGYIWIGTDGGLYRFNGKEFRVFNLWDTDKDDIYFVNSLYQDSEDRLWVCTGNYGLFYIKGSEAQHFTDEYYAGIKCVNDVREASDGTIYVATTYGLYTVNKENMTLQLSESLSGRNVKKLTTAKGRLWGIVGDGSFFMMSDEGNIVTVSAASYTQEELSCIFGMEDGSVYIGTPGTDILHIDKNFRGSSLSSGKDGINALFHDGKRLFVCAESGMGYFDTVNSFHGIYDTEVNRYISCMMMDYEGGYWFASSRYGVLQLGISKFRNFNELYGINATSTNCIRAVGDDLYIGTDENLLIMDEKNRLKENDLTDYLTGASVRDVMQDSHGNLWISTSRRYGVIRRQLNGKIVNYGRGNGLPTNQVNSTLELRDGTIAVNTEEGIAILDADANLIRTYTHADGLAYPNILCLYQAEDGRLFAGSDGGGLYIIKGDIVKNYTENDGLTSNVVTSIVPGEKGIWIGTDNGLSIFTEGIRAISNIDFSNNIYDLQTEDTEKGIRLWIVGSKGVISATEDELLGANPLTQRYLAGGDGLDKRITLNGRCLLKDHVLYICCSTGIMMLHTQVIPKNGIAPRLTVSEIDADSMVYHLDQLGGSLTIPADTQRLSISFAVLSYSNRENVVVEYKLGGFDSEPINISPSEPMQAVYTNLEGGTYTFTVRAINGDGVPSEQDITFTIHKEFGFFEKQSTRIILFSAAGILLILFIIGMLRLLSRMRGQYREIEKLEKEHEVAVKSSTAKTDFLAHMSNEIKIPVNAIISLADTMQREQNEETRQEGLRAIASSGKDILGKVDETIQLARLESGRITVTESAYSITTLMCDISDRMINTLDQKPVRFLVDLGERIPDVMIGDFDKIRNILEILLDNASKYTREGTITLFVDCYSPQETPDMNRLSFSISDTGIGIQNDRLQHIFEVYNIADNKKQTGYTGSGISLAIAKKLAEIMGGEIDVESTYGAGSTFTVTLPQKKADQNVVTAASGEGDLRVTREEAERMLAPEVKALIVDDVEISRTVAANVLRQMEITPDLAESGMQAVDYVMNRDYDIVFMDLAMPVMNGTDALREIRELERDGAGEIPIIAMSEDAINEDPDALKEAGFTDVLIKPIELAGLGAFLQQYYPEKIRFRTQGQEKAALEETGYNEKLSVLEDVLDVRGVLEKIGGSVDMYHRILSTFYTQNRQAPEELKKLFTGNYRSFRSRIHNIRNGAQNIGATELTGQIVRIDSAINIGNKSYVRDNLSSLCSLLEEVLHAIARYLGEEGDTAVDEISRYTRGVGENPGERMGVETEEEKKKTEPAEKRSRKRKQQKMEQIDFKLLDALLEAAQKKDVDGMEKQLAEISSCTYGGEDTEFLQVLSSEVEKNNTDSVTDLIETYKELKQ